MKKQKLLTIFQRLVPYRDQAQVFCDIIESEEVSQEVVEKITQILKKNLQDMQVSYNSSEEKITTIFQKGGKVLSKKDLDELLHIL